MAIFKWTPVSICSDPDNTFLRSMSEFIGEKELPLCPLCKKSELRFYSHRFHFKKYKPHNLDRTSLWMWCNNCFHWHVQVFGGIDNPNAIDEDHLKKIDDYRLVEKLNEYWEQGIIPHSLQR